MAVGVGGGYFRGNGRFRYLCGHYHPIRQSAWDARFWVSTRRTPVG